MTMQMADTFLYQGGRAEAVAISRKFSFSPVDDFGIATVSWSTSNHRGFWCDYSIDKTLVIKNLYLYSKDHVYPPIKGKNAEEIPQYTHLLDDINKKACVKKQYRHGFPMQYTGIDYDYKYSGRIVLGTDPAQGKTGRERYKSVRRDG